MNTPIFITARFRTGSTLLWNIFRQVPEVVAYYEPLHEKLPQMINFGVVPQPSHDKVENYFSEYKSVEELTKHHSAEFGVCRLYLTAEDKYPQLQNYIQYLLDSTDTDKTPVLQFNRVDFRLPWLKANFPNVPIIHLYRSPREQWLSSIASYPQFSDSEIDIDPYLITTWSRDICQHFPFLATPFIRHAYQRHYYLWKLSYLAGSRLSNLSISYEELLAQPETTVAHLLKVAGLDVNSNLEKCLAAIVQKPVQKWKQYRDEAWFLELEQECEATLNQLGLNHQFPQKNVAEIITTNHQYQALMADEKNHSWAISNSQINSVELQIISEEKERIISQLNSAAEERQKLILQFQDAFDSKDKLIFELQNAAEERRILLSRLESEIIAKQTYINSLLNFYYTLIAPSFERRLKNFLRRYSLIRKVQDSLGKITPKLIKNWNYSSYSTQFRYSPKPLKVPQNYYQTKVASQQSLPTVSIVTPSFNQGNFIERTIKSVVEQNYSHMEYIIQDGGSTDETLAILEKYSSKLARVESRKDNGQSHAINLGFHHATGEIMAYLNSDDMLLPGTIPYVVNFFLNNPDVDVVYGHRILVDENDADVGRWVLPPHDSETILWADFIPQETLFWRRRIWDKVGGCIDESYRYTMDWELILRFHKAGAKFARLNRFLGIFRIHPSQKTTAWIDIGYQEMEKLRRLYHGRCITQIEVEYRIKPFTELWDWYYRLYCWGIFRVH